MRIIRMATHAPEDLSHFPFFSLHISSGRGMASHPPAFGGLLCWLSGPRQVLAIQSLRWPCLHVLKPSVSQMHSSPTFRSLSASHCQRSFSFDFSSSARSSPLLLCCRSARQVQCQWTLHRVAMPDDPRPNTQSEGVNVTIRKQTTGRSKTDRSKTNDSIEGET
jgi:hypothetical protein